MRCIDWLAAPMTLSIVSKVLTTLVFCDRPLTVKKVITGSHFKRRQYIGDIVTFQFEKKPKAHVIHVLTTC